MVPCFNEEKRINLNYFEELSSLPNVEIIFYDDGSNDMTRNLLKKFVSNIPTKTRLLWSDQNCGKAKAILDAWRKVYDEEFNYIGMLDADGATSIIDVCQIVSLIDSKKDYDAIWGSRAKLAGRQINRKLYRHIIGRTLHYILRKLYRQEIYDTQAGIKIFKKSTAIEKIIHNSKLSSKWFLEIEILCQIHEQGSQLLIWEEPLYEWKDVKGSKLKLSNFLQIFVSVIKMFKRYKLKFN